MAKIYFLLEDMSLQKEFERITQEYATATQTADIESIFCPDLATLSTALKAQPPVEEGKPPDIRIVYLQISLQRKNWLQIIPKVKELSPQTSFVILKFEDAGISKLDLLQPAFDDLIYLPMDRSIFLQKMQILMALPKKASPTFLFHVEKPMDIEVSKLTQLTSFNDCIWWMDNPMPLQKGLPSHFYLTVPPHGPVISAQAKSILSQQHHEKKGQYQVAFALMGVHREELTQLRVQMQQTFKTHLLLDEGKVPLEKPLHFGVADGDQAIRERLHEMIEREMPGVHVSMESSLTLLIQDASAQTDWDKVTGTAAADFPKVPFEFLIHKDSKDFKSFKTDIAAEHLWLGYGLEDWKAGPQKWWAAFESEENKNLFDEAMFMVQGPGHPHWNRTVLVKDSAATMRQVHVELIMDKEDQVLVRLTPQEHVLKPTQAKNNAPFDLIIISSKFLTQNAVPRLEGLNLQTKCPNFLILIDHNEKVDPVWLTSPFLKGVSIKPIDPRHLMVLIAQTFDRPDLKYSMDNLGFAKANWNVHAARPAKLTSISEYGVTLELTRPIRNGTFLFLRQGVFDKAPNHCLCVRSYISEEREKNKYHVSFMYFGIQDDFLKHVRTLVKELFALEKSAEGAG